MALLIPPGFALISWNMRHTLASKDWTCTWGVDIGEAGGDLEAVALQQIGVFSASTLLARQDSNIVNVSVTVQAGSDPNPGPILEVENGAVGGATVTSPPPNVATLVRKTTGLGGRYNRGRFYWPGFLGTTDLNELGVINTAARAAIQTDFTAFRVGLETAVSGSVFATPMVILHDEASPATTPTPVTALFVDSLASTQRRRMRN